MFETATVYALISAVLLALRDIFGRFAVRGIDPITGTAFTAIVGLPVLWIVSAARGDFSDPWPGLGWPLLFIAIAGIFRVCFARTMLFAATQHIGSARTSTIVATNLIFASSFGVAFLGESLTFSIVLGALLVFAGYLFIAGSHTKNDNGDPSQKPYVGMALALGCALAFGAAAVLVRPSVGFFTSPNEANFYSNIFAVGAFAPFLFRRGKIGEIKNWTPGNWGFLVLAGMSASLGVTFLYLALANAPVVYAFPISQSRPLFAIAISWTFLQSEEKMNWRVVAGALAIFAGTVTLIFNE
ncbi:MAG: EamA family transporter [Nitrospinae bacterium]|nr:EamA family transporter [Nitrospinota bacterium]